MFRRIFIVQGSQQLFTKVVDSRKNSIIAIRLKHLNIGQRPYEDDNLKQGHVNIAITSKVTCIEKGNKDMLQCLKTCRANNVHVLKMAKTPISKCMLFEVFPGS